jgi:hypothetical protein
VVDFIVSLKSFCFTKCGFEIPRFEICMEKGVQRTYLYKQIFSQCMYIPDQNEIMTSRGKMSLRLAAKTLQNILIQSSSVCSRPRRAQTD